MPPSTMQSVAQRPSREAMEALQLRDQQLTLSNGRHQLSFIEYERLYKASLADPEAFWGKMAQDLHWHKRWQSPFTRSNLDVRIGPISMEWFIGAQTNICYNAVDRHVKAGHGDRIAYFWEGNTGSQTRQVSYSEMLLMVCRLANYLKSVGIKEGDDVTIYMPMIPELPAAMLACMRIGAVHSVVFGGFSAQSLAGRISDSQPKIVITASGAMRGAKTMNLKAIVDDAVNISTCSGYTVEHVLVFSHESAVKKADIFLQHGRDHWWHDVVDSQSSQCDVVWLDAEARSFKLYTSGSTGKPKGVEHTVAGYMVGAASTFKYVFDYQDGDIYWCTADCGWITGHTYVVHGPMLLGATQVMYEGMLTYPDASRPWAIVEKYKVNQMYTAPTVIRSLMAKGDHHVTKHVRDSLRILGSVGEPLNPEAYEWYHQVVGAGECQVMDTYFQTETGAFVLTPLPGATKLKPGSVTLPFFGAEPAILDDQGREIQGKGEGSLVMKRLPPSCMRTLSGDHGRYEAVYFEPYKGYYYTGDGCRRDDDGYFWIKGRIDDVINVAGHRLGTAEVEAALDMHPAVAEAAVVPYGHDIKGQGIYAFVSLMHGHSYPGGFHLKEELLAVVRRVIGPIATPDIIHWSPGLPKTRSGKIMRRILRKVADKEEASLGDISTLADPGVIEVLLAMRGK